MNRLNRRRAFTLIELLVIVSIIAAIVSISYWAVSGGPAMTTTGIIVNKTSFVDGGERVYQVVVTKGDAQFTYLVDKSVFDQVLVDHQYEFSVNKSDTYAFKATEIAK